MSSTDLARRLLVGVTLLVVVSDSMLVPFYPRFFERALGVRSSVHIGTYVGATCAVVMLAYPVWAWVARARDSLRLLVSTQLAAGVLACLAACATSAAEFWVLSLSMIWFKGSYLLIYPYLMALPRSDDGGYLIGLLTVVVHFGTIGGAVLGGMLLEHAHPGTLLIAMGAADALQALVCLWMLRFAPRSPTAPRLRRVSATAAVRTLALVMGAFCFSAFMTRPFFAAYWSEISGLDDAWIAGWVYAIPGGVAVLALLWNQRRQRRGYAPHALGPMWLVGALGLVLQSLRLPELLLGGRVLYGFALFQITVGLERRLFGLSSPDRYATDFAKLHVAQNAGALGAALVAGATVDLGLELPLVLGALGLLLTGAYEINAARPDPLADPAASPADRAVS